MEHPVRRTLADLDRMLAELADVPVEYMSVEDKRASLELLAGVEACFGHFKLRLMHASDDVADEDGSRDIASWLASHTRTDRATSARHHRLAIALDRWSQISQAMAAGRLHMEQAEAIVRALEALPDDVSPELANQAEAHLVAQAAEFGPRELGVLGRKVLDVVAPEIGEAHELRRLEDEEARALATTSLTSTRDGCGSTVVRIKLPDASADRLLTYVEAYAAPRQGDADHALRADQRLGHAFCALLERLDPATLPQHGGDATTVLVTVDLDTLRHGLGTATLLHGGAADTKITASEARRLACAAKLIPAVLGGDSQPLDLGRSARLFSPAQRKAMALRDRTCRAHGCDIPATWCEAHHDGEPWATGGRTDLADGVLLCTWHHHRVHDDRYLHNRLPNGDIRFARRT